MRLFTMRLAATLASCMLMSGNALSAPSRASDFAGAAPEAMMMSANALTDNRAEHFASSMVPDFRNPGGVVQSERLHLAFVTPPIAPPLGGSRSGDTSSAPFYAEGAEQPPSVWLMGSVILFLLAYQLRRKHRLLRPHRFHEL